MRVRSFLLATLVVVCFGLWGSAGCGSKQSTFGQDGSADDATTPELDAPLPVFPDVSPEAKPTCVGLECQVDSCGGNVHTTVSGIVYDPAGRNPLYNVYVYVPNAPVQPITSGAVCTACQAPASGSPLPGAVQTDALGKFTVTDVPTGSNIPLVMQAGKFRRQIIIPTVNSCVDNPVGKKDSNGLETLTRLPRKQNEGNNNVDNIPQIAMATGGCDVLECLMRKIGIADTEFSSTGRVHLFQGNGGASGSGSTSAYTFWSNKTELMKHDIVLNSCECSPYNRDTNGSAYTSVRDYLNGGGRFFGTHYHYNWFAPPTGPTEFQSTANWLSGVSGYGPPFYINTTIPKGVALNQWIQNVWKSAPPPQGQINLAYAAGDVSQIQGKTTPWIYYANPNLSSNAYSTAYLSFNTPVSAQPAQQCGRAVFSDLHVSNGGGSGSFPSECGVGDPLTTAMTQQETALEFLFFDLSSCVGDDTAPPPPPPPN